MPNKEGSINVSHLLRGTQRQKEGSGYHTPVASAPRCLHLWQLAPWHCPESRRRPEVT
jgi:hypothetical protein